MDAIRHLFDECNHYHDTSKPRTDHFPKPGWFPADSAPILPEVRCHHRHQNSSMPKRGQGTHRHVTRMSRCLRIGSAGRSLMPKNFTISGTSVIRMLGISRKRGLNWSPRTQRHRAQEWSASLYAQSAFQLMAKGLQIIEEANRTGA